MCRRTFWRTARMRSRRNGSCSDAHSLPAGHKYGQLRHQRQHPPCAGALAESADGPGFDLGGYRGGVAFFGGDVLMNISHPEAELRILIPYRTPGTLMFP